MAHWLCMLILFWLAGSAAAGQAWRKRLEANPDLAQYRRNEPLWLSPGVSIGGGALQYPLGLTADLHYGPATLRLHPGYWHWGVGVQYYFDVHAAAVSMRQRPWYVAMGYLRAWDWALPDDPNLQGRQRASFVFGHRHALSRPGDVYVEYGLGLMVRWDEYQPPGQAARTEYTYLPTGEIRLGVAFLGKRWLPRAGRPWFRRKLGG